MTVQIRRNGREPVLSWLAATLLVLVVVEVVSATVVAARSSQSFTDVTNSFALTNLAIAVSFGGCGALLAWHRPHYPVGWLFGLSGVLQGATGVAATVLLAVGAADQLSASTRVAATVFSWAWPWSMGVGFLLALLFFPDGRLPSRRWRPVAVVIALTGVAFVLSSGTDPASSVIGGRLFPHAGAWEGYARAGGLWTGVTVLNIACLVTVVGSLAVRYRRGDEVVRRQLLWLILAGVAVVVVVTPVVLLRAGSVLFLLVLLFVPAAIVIAVLRHNLLDIRLVLSLSLSWAALSAVVGLLYLVLVGVLGSVLAGAASTVLATAVVALAAHPLRMWLQATSSSTAIAPTPGACSTGSDPGCTAPTGSRPWRRRSLSHFGCRSLPSALTARSWRPSARRPARSTPCRSCGTGRGWVSCWWVFAEVTGGPPARTGTFWT